uniref:Putative secreted protein n=1 Tax=Anopheles darlingi TaxID=43151 RepID=A0A2M4DC17_ANODA
MLLLLAFLFPRRSTRSTVLGAANTNTLPSNTPTTLITRLLMVVLGTMALLMLSVHCPKPCPAVTVFRVVRAYCLGYKESPKHFTLGYNT